MKDLVLFVLGSYVILEGIKFTLSGFRGWNNPEFRKEVERMMNE